jgi:hypothetical protein
MNSLLSDQPLQVVGQTTSTKSQGELSSLVDSIVLSLDDKVGERVDEFAVVVKRVEDGRSRGLRRHGVMLPDGMCLMLK